TGEQCGDKPIAVENFVMKASRSSGEVSRQIRIEVSDCSAQGWSESFSPLACARTNDDRAKLRGRRCSKERRVKSRGLGLLVERTLHQHVRRHSDNRPPRLRLTGIKNSD